MPNNKLNPKMFTLAREVRGLSRAELAEHTGISRSNISRFESNEIQLPEESLSKLIDYLGFHRSLYHETIDILPPAFYRKRDKVATGLLTQIDAVINLYNLNISKLLEKTGHSPEPPPSFSTNAGFSPTEAATKLRKFWKLPKGVIPNLIELLEEKGFIFVPVDFGTERVDSRSLLVNNNCPVIYYNTQLLGDRLRYTIGYELGHLIMHTRTQLDYSLDLSHQANLFAAEFLMPEEDILKDLKGDINTDLLANLKLKWKVSMHALLYRSEDLGVITENQKRYIINTFNLFKIRRREPKELDAPLEKPRLLRNLLTTFRTKQKMTITQLSAFFHMSEAEFLKSYNQ